MITPNAHLKSISRDSEVIHRGAGVIYLDRNERISSFEESIFQNMMSGLHSSLFNEYPNLGPLYERLEAYVGYSQQHIAVGAGSDALIRRAFQAFLSPGDVVVAPDPSYGMYAVWSRVFQADFQTVPYGSGPDFRFDVDTLIDLVEKGAKICCVANSDQPTGSVLNLDQLSRIADACQKNDALFIIDEAYFPFCTVTALELIKKFDNVLVLRTFSKIGGIAGLRVGYGIALPDIITALHIVRSPGEVNAVGAYVAGWLLDHPEEMEHFRLEIEVSRRNLIAASHTLGFETPLCTGNFQLLKVPEGIEVSDLLNDLLSQGFMIKGEFQHFGLKKYVRVTLDVPEIINAFIGKLETVICSRKS